VRRGSPLRAGRVVRCITGLTIAAGIDAQANSR
jgi:hypothetical protein